MQCSFQPRKSSVLSLLVMLLLCGLLAGCSRYPHVDRRTYDFAKALYAVCSAQDPDRLQRLIDQLDAEEGLTPREAEWLREMTKKAQDGQWQHAQQMARQLMADQVEGG